MPASAVSAGVRTHVSSMKAGTGRWYHQAAVYTRSCMLVSRHKDLDLG